MHRSRRKLVLAAACAVSALCVVDYRANASSGNPLGPARMIIGGPGTCGSDGFNDPGRLNDGITEGAADFTFVLNPGDATLTLTVENTSPVLVGVPNPLITDVYFNCPAEIIGMTLMSQTSARGVTPAFDLTFDADLDSSPNPNGAAGFGAYSVGLNNPGGIAGAIANPDADTYAPDRATLAVGPVTFVLSLTGDLGALSSEDFTTRFSVVPPGSKVATGVAKFQSGGVAEASGSITSTVVECFLVISPGPGNSPFVSPGMTNHLFPTALSHTSRAYGMTNTGPVIIPVDTLPRPRSHNWGAGYVHEERLAAQFFVQGFLWNPEGIPTYPEQWSGGYQVTVWPNGLAIAQPYGDVNGMTLGVQTLEVNGRMYLKFPFLLTPN